MHEFAAEVSADRTETTLRWSSTSMKLDADRLEELIGLLGHVRAHMRPEIPNEALKPGDRTSLVPAVRWSVSADPDAPTCIRLWLMHPGFGWLYVPLDEAGATSLQAALPELLDKRPKLS